MPISKKVFLNSELEHWSVGKYNSNGKLLQLTTDSISCVSYLYGYGGLYPVARVEGTDYDTLLSWLTSDFINSLTTAKGTALTAKIAQLRSRIKEKGALVTTYTWRPLVGITSVTDPKGQTTSFDYDSKGRLAYSQNALGVITEEWNYNLKNK